MKSFIDISNWEMNELVMWGLTWLLMVITMIFVIRLLVRVKQMKKSIDTATQKVEKYVNYILEEDKPEEEDMAAVCENTKENLSSYGEDKHALTARMQESEEQTHLISSVLQEIFP